MPLRPYQEAALHDVGQHFNDGARAVCCVCPTGCHAAGQPILRYDGTIVPVESVQVGDLIMGPDSQPRQVLHLIRGQAELFRVVPTKGEPFTATRDHVLTLVRTNTGDDARAGELVDVTLEEWMRWSAWRKHIHKLVRVGVYFPQHGPDLPLDPYFLGVMLGDGSMQRIVNVTKPDQEIIDACSHQAASHGLNLTMLREGPNASYNLSGGRGGGAPNPIMSKLGSLGLRGADSETKFVPHAYLTASRFQRLSLLAGLIDTDGSLGHSGYDFISKSERLARDVTFLSRSVGLAAYVTPCRKTCQTGATGTYYRVSISGDASIIPCRIPRKVSPPRQQKKDVLRTGFTVESIEPGSFFGFTIDGDGRYLLGDFTVTHNSGKSIIATSWLTGDSGLRNAPRRHHDTGLFLVHRDQLRQQAFEHLERVLPGDIGMIGPRTNPNPDGRIQVATIQTLLARGELPECRRIIADECFPAGTLIGNVPIEKLRVGDIVPSFDERTGRLVNARVLDVMCREATTLVRIRAGQRDVVCTPNHPFLVMGRGWIPAVNLTQDDYVATNDVLDDHHVLDMRAHVHAPDHRSDAVPAHLLSQVPLRKSLTHDVSHEHQARVEEDDTTQPDAPAGRSREGLGIASGDRPQAHNERWQRKTAIGSASDPRARPELADGSRGPDRQRIPAASLQDRHRASGTEDRDRSGREFAPDPRASSAGLEEGDVPTWARVDAVEILEPGSPERPGAMPPDGVVYNLHVEGTHTYVANGFVVHNCHHFAANEWRPLLDAYPHAKILGLTATPERQDGRPLGDIFEHLVVGARYPELVTDGHLVPCRAYAPPQQVEDGIANDPVAMYQRYGEGGSGFLFADSIPNAELWAERFSEAGIPAVAVHQKTPPRDRARAMDAFTAGQVRILSNVFLFTEGTDVPAARVCILARPVTHVSMYLQIAGRVLRPAPGKTDAILLDLCGSVHEHGLPTMDRTYSLDGRAIRRTVESVRQCPQCGAVHDGAPPVCDLCGYVFPVVAQSEPAPPRIYDIELREVYAGGDTPEPARWREFERLVQVAESRDYSLSWVVKQFVRLFHEPPTEWLAGLSEETRQREYRKLAALGLERGYKPGFAAARYRETFGAWPPWSWRNAAPANEPTADVPF